MRKKTKSTDAILARSRLYRWLSGRFLYPEAARLADPAQAWEGAWEAAVLTGSRALRGSVARLKALPSSPEDLQQEHAAAFGHTVAKECPPYETCYGNSHVFMQTQELADIAGFYRAWGLEVSEAAKERADHVSVELEFMAYLAVKEGYATGKGEPDKAALCRAAQRKFLSEHLGRWVLGFSGLLERKGGAYGLLARSLRELVAWDARRLGAKPVELRSVDVRPIGPGIGTEGAVCGLGQACGQPDAEVN